jgi:hypothetical protein
MGNGARRLQRRRRRLELLLARSGPLPRLSLGRRRHRGHFGRSAAALLRARPLERQGPDSQGTAVRPDQQRKQPRRGRQGVLLLPRQHADAFVHEVPLQVSAGGVSVCEARRYEPRPQPQRVRVRTARHRRVRRRPLLRRVRRICQSVPGRHARRDQRVQSRPRRSGDLRFTDALVSQSMVVADERGKAVAGASAKFDQAADNRSPRRQAGHALSLHRRRRRNAVYRERNQHAANLRRRQPQSVRQGQHQ